MEFWGIENFALFLLASLMVSTMPGPDLLYLTGRTLQQGKSAGLMCVLGISAGCLIHTLLAALGLSALLLTSAIAFHAVKWAGALYLIFLGLKLLFSKIERQQIGELKEASLGKVFIQAFLTNLLNPKAALFFLALLPQFIAADAGSKTAAFLLLGVIFVLENALWFLLVVVFMAALGGFFRGSSRARLILDKVTGTLFIGLGIRLAMEERV